MPELNLKFTTTAQLEGARQIERTLEQQIGKAKALGKDYSALQTQLNGLKPAIAQSAAALNTTAVATDKVSISTKDWVRQLKALKYEAGGLPGVGTAIHMVRAPIVAAAVATGVFVAALKQYYEQYKAIKALGRDLDDAYGRAAKAAKPPEVMAMEWNAAMAKMRQGIEEAAQKGMESLGALDSKLKEIETRIGRTKTLSEKGLAADEAQIDADVAAGRISKEEGAKRKEAARGAHRTRLDWARVLGQGEKERAIEQERATMEARAGMTGLLAERAGGAMGEANDEARRLGIVKAAADARVAAALKKAGVSSVEELEHKVEDMRSFQKGIRGPRTGIFGELLSAGIGIQAGRTESDLRNVRLAEEAQRRAGINLEAAQMTAEQRKAAFGELGGAAAAAKGSAVELWIRGLQMEEERRKENAFMREERDSEARKDASEREKAEAEAENERLRKQMQIRQQNMRAIESGQPWKVQDVEAMGDDLSANAAAINDKLGTVLLNLTNQLAAINQTLDTFV